MFRIKLLILSFSLLFISGCGFQPLYHQDNEFLRHNLASIKVEEISGRLGQQLNYYLYDLFNPTQDPVDWNYLLKIELSKSNVAVGIKKDSRVTRYNVIVRADYQLFTLEGNELIDKGNVNIIAAYDSAESQYATYIAEHDAEKRAVKGLGEELRVLITSTLLNRGQK